MSSILEARERRWRTKHTLARRFRACVLSLCLNIPGPDKNPPGAERAFVFLQAALRVAHARALRRWHGKRSPRRKASLYEVRGSSADGPSWILLSPLPGFTLKRMAVTLERKHPLGRLADIDVLTQAGDPISRADLGQPPRACFLCGEPAALCRRSRRHSQEMLMAFVAATLSAARAV
jgi:holo-ACP synthase